MSRSLVAVIFHQIIGSPRHPKRSSYDRKPRNRDYERAMYKLKQAAFENKQAYEQAHHHARAKGWIR